MKKQNAITIPKELLDELEKEAERKARKTIVPAVCDDVIKRYAGKVSWTSLTKLLCKCFNVTVSRTTVRARAAVLLGEKGQP